MKTAIIGIGTNLGDRSANIQSALRSLEHLPGTKIEKVSSVYETEPWGYTQQDNFYNICVSVATELSPEALLGACLGIEAAYGRERPFKNSPRILDMDILMYEGVTKNSAELNLPHPLISDRAFVLVPLKDVLASLVFNDSDYNNAYNTCEKAAVKRLSDIKPEIKNCVQDC